MRPGPETGPGRAGSEASYPGTSKAESHAERGRRGFVRRIRRTTIVMSSEAASTATGPDPLGPEPLAALWPAAGPPTAQGPGFP